MRSIPEKTLEHWTSMYLAQEFPRCELWWPANGEDVSVDHFPNRPGKSVLLEIKTAEWTDSGHRVEIDVRQLQAYQTYMVPVYYVFPVPPWKGVLEEGNRWLAGNSRGMLFRRTNLWFGHWLFVVRAQTIWNWLGQRRQLQSKATLYSQPAGANQSLHLTHALGPCWPWELFWHEMARCGSDQMTSLMTVPSFPLGERDWSPRRALSILLTEWYRSGWEEGMPTRRFVPDVEGYRNIEMFEPVRMTIGSSSRASTALVHLDAGDLSV